MNHFYNLTLNRFSVLAVLFALLLLLAGCDNRRIEPPCEGLSANFLPSPSQALFLDLAFEQEFGQSANRLRKWSGPISIFVRGTSSQAILHEVDAVIEELSELSTSIALAKVGEAEASNLTIFLGRKEDYTELVEPAAAGIAEGNSGFATIAWNDEFEIIRASACIDVVNQQDLAFLKHVIREELAQTLGLINDTELDQGSIFHQFIDTSQTYSPTDRKMIAYMLGGELQAGMCKLEAMDIVD